MFNRKNSMQAKGFNKNSQVPLAASNLTISQNAGLQILMNQVLVDSKGQHRRTVLWVSQFRGLIGLKILGLLLLVVLVVASSLAGAEFSRTLYLLEGGARQISLPPGNLWVSKPGVVKILKGAQGQAKILALKKGAVQIHAQQVRWQVQVHTPQSLRSYQILKTWTGSKLGPKVSYSEGRVLIKGRILRISDWRELSEISQKNDLLFHFQARLHPRIQREAKKFIRASLQAKENYQWSPSEPGVLQAGLLSAQSPIKSQAKRLGLHLIESEKNSSRPLVRLRVLFAEVSRSFQQVLGFEWPTSFSAQIAPGFSSPSPWSLTLQMVQSDALGKVLATPNLLCRSGGEAEFLAGGEIPLKISTRSKQAVQWKNFGVRLKFKPLVTELGEIQLDLLTELSLKDEKGEVGGIPGLKTNRIRSQVDVKDGQLIVLSGLLKQTYGESRSGLAGLASLPVLGPLFQSHRFQEGESELMVVIQPEVVNKGEE